MTLSFSLSVSLPPVVLAHVSHLVIQAAVHLSAPSTRERPAESARRCRFPADPILLIFRALSDRSGLPPGGRTRNPASAAAAVTPKIFFVMTLTSALHRRGDCAADYKSENSRSRAGGELLFEREPKRAGAYSFGISVPRLIFLEERHPVLLRHELQESGHVFRRAEFPAKRLLVRLQEAMKNISSPS